MQISGQTFLVCGGSSGLGAACARELVRRGAKVVIADIDVGGGQRLVGELGDAARFVRTDVADEASVVEALAATLQGFGGLRGVIQCAGIALAKSVIGTSQLHPLEDFNRVLQVNLSGTFNVCRLATAAMLRMQPSETGERGVIVMTSSVAAFEGSLGQAAYAASKGGVAALALPLAREFAAFGIRVVAIAPGIFDTPMLAGMPERARTTYIQQLEFPRRLGQPQEFASLAMHVIENEMLNGTVLRLDAGLRMAPRALTEEAPKKSPTATELPVFIEKGTNPRVLVIAFTGFAGQLMMNPFEFFQVSGLLNYSRILLRDDSKRCFLGGLEPVAGSFDELLSWLRNRIRELAPEKVLAIGTSGGAGCAMHVAHELKLDYVHAFAPYTFLDEATNLKYQQEEMMAKFRHVLESIWALPADVHKYFNTAEVLKTTNGVTRYYVHVCAQNPQDMIRARHVIGCPGVTVLAYPCQEHAVSQYLAQQKRLMTVLQIENQEDLPRMLNVRMEPPLAKSPA